MLLYRRLLIRGVKVSVIIRRVAKSGEAFLAEVAARLEARNFGRVRNLSRYYSRGSHIKLPASRQARSRRAIARAPREYALKSAQRIKVASPSRPIGGLGKCSIFQRDSCRQAISAAMAQA